ncbi:MAG: type II toxin-antitoxin system MqsR family toxin [Selenomonadaceae bacterium]|nr:type II toxin-antitoxin system MqsR family toxin [Selenomonadaceae bacterium]MDD6120564.1 type II toxin-antitoxin system MqsR family toxin [Selenomonadaceae bacterium]MDD7056818.1 type II toxin-antitoxin system MqsR family toxin [Selenomonadaceae bacterium]
MEKRKPTYDLDSFKQSDFAITKKATQTAAELGLDDTGIRQVVAGMEPSMFYKSMTSYANHRIWQDVYHVPWNDDVLYVKFTEGVISEFLLLSFKRK